MHSASLRPAATTILLRERAEGPEVWLMERNRSVSFMASAWVFPGGRVDPEDGALDGPVREGIPVAFWRAAARELEEEAGVRLGDHEYDLGLLRPWAHWITPEIEPRRYDTWFFVARLPEGATPRVDGGEAVDGGWFTFTRAIQLADEGRLPVAPPTLRTLHELSGHTTVASVFAARRRFPPTCPRFTSEGDALYVLLPGDPEYPSDDPVEPPYRYAFAHGRWWVGKVAG